MRGEYQTQMICISETSGQLFELKMNEALKSLVNPDIRLDQTRPFTAYIFYQVQHDIPESIIEAIELIEGSKHYCDECPACEIPEDKRKKWYFCLHHKKKIHNGQTACIDFYKLRASSLIATDSEE